MKLWTITIALTVSSTIIFFLIFSHAKFQDSYLYCACGCCPDTEPVQQCVNSTEFEAITQAETQGDCSIEGCSRGINYSECK